MRKSKYLVLSSFYFDFNNDLSEIKEIKALFENQNILDLFRFDKMKIIIKKNFFANENINFIYLPVSIEKIGECAFLDCRIQILDLSNCIKLKNIERSVFYENQIKYFKLPQTIENINNFEFSINQIKLLDLSQCIHLKYIDDYSFKSNQIKQLKLPQNIEEIRFCAFEYNQIESLDLSNCIKLKKIEYYAFSSNPLEEIKILGNIEIQYKDEDDDDLWNNFTKYYNDNNKKAGDYKLENNKWKWYPL